MNAQIKQILNDVGLDVQHGGIILAKHVSAGWALEKFAELLIKECAKIADDGYASDNLGNGIQGYQLLRHFGVEE
jgi:hypothetical protein